MLSLYRIKAEVARAFGLKADDVAHVRGGHTLENPRTVAMYLSCVYARYSMTCVGRAYGGIDCTSVRYAIRKADVLMKAFAPGSLFVRQLIVQLNAMNPDTAAVEAERQAITEAEYICFHVRRLAAERPGRLKAVRSAVELALQPKLPDTVMKSPARALMERTRRTCLGCGTKFISEGRHNRLCPKCRRRPVAAESCEVPV